MTSAEYGTSAGRGRREGLRIFRAHNADGTLKHELLAGAGIFRGGREDKARSWDAGAWLLLAASLLLAANATAMGIVSYHAQFAFVLATKHQQLPATLEALGLDAAAVTFSVLGIALARLGRRAVIERVLVCACAAGSLGMNALGANLGSPRSVAVYVMPPVLFAVGSDRLVAVIRRAALGPRDDDENQRSAWRTGALVGLYALRLVVALPSTVTGARCALLNSTPLPTLAAPEPVRAIAAQPEPLLIGRDPYDDSSDLWAVDGEIERRPHEFPHGVPLAAGLGQCRLCCAVAHTTDDGSIADHLTPWGVACPAYAADDDGQDHDAEREQLQPGETKTAAMLRLVAAAHGPLAGFPLPNVARVAGEMARRVDLHPGAARKALRAAVVAATDEALGGVA